MTQKMWDVKQSTIVVLDGLTCISEGMSREEGVVRTGRVQHVEGRAATKLVALLRQLGLP